RGAFDTEDELQVYQGCGHMGDEDDFACHASFVKKDERTSELLGLIVSNSPPHQTIFGLEQSSSSSGGEESPGSSREPDTGLSYGTPGPATTTLQATMQAVKVRPRRPS
ncbi:MAG: hypothetical protein Q9184_002612, partial [Pyrenodesmia sp. 2 TL-2023]